jgi:antitoxin (DNA-binding transcriptional repressor) of toxin-antitoxin stability system
MITVGVRDLKNQLSFYLQYVKNGETIIVTEHNKIIAEINMPENERKYSSVKEKMMELSKEGDIILAKRSKTCVKLQKPKEKLDWETVYNEIRADRKS